MSTTNEEQQMLDLMTPEEREAMQDENYSPEEIAAMKGIAGDSDEGDDDDEDSGDEPAAEQKAKQKADDSVNNADTGEEAPEGDDEPEFKPRYRAELPADFNDQVANLNAEMTDLAQKLRAGDIEFDEYNATQAELLAKRDELNAIKLKADIASDMGAQTAEQEWAYTVDRFMKSTAKAEGIDYAKDEAKQKDLDMFVKVLAQDNSNSDKSMAWFLQEAHKRVKALHGVSTETKREDPPAKPKRNTPTATIPKTLAQVPGGDGPGDVADEFANLDGLEGMQLEEAIAKMSPAQRERYAQAA